MKKIVWITALLLSAAGYVYLQTTPSAPPLATLLPGGALLYLETPDFARLLHDWDSSQVKAPWLQSANYSVFSRSNLFTKLQGVYSEYGEAAGFLPDLPSVIGIAGTHSALALYGIRDVEFLYLTRIGEGDFMKSPLWAVRGKFEQRQAGGVSFYLRTDASSKRTVAFAFTRGYLLLGTRDDLVAQALELMAGAKNPNIASGRWYHDAAAAASNPGDLRLVMNLDSLDSSVYFRSYWVQRNASFVRQYWTGVADIHRADGNITESRVFLRSPDAPRPPLAPSVSNLLALVPAGAGMYKASLVSDPGNATALVVQKLIAPQSQPSRDLSYAPAAVSGADAGSEGDLETRIDQQPLPLDSGLEDSVAAVRALLETSGVRALLLVQSSALAGAFVQTPSVIVLQGSADWDDNAVRTAVSAAAGKFWTTSQLGAGWTTDSSGPQPLNRLDGLATLVFTNRGNLLFLANEVRLLQSVLATAGAQPSTAVYTYAAGFRHLRERANYERIMTALDFTSPSPNGQIPFGGAPGDAPPFFSGNMGSLSRVLAILNEVQMTREDRADRSLETVLYRMSR